MSEQFPGAFIFDYPFPVVDAAIAEWALSLSNEGLRARREALSSGSARYLLHRRAGQGRAVGEIKVRMMAQETLLTVAPLYIDIADFDAWMRYLLYLVGTFQSWLIFDQQSRPDYIREARAQEPAQPSPPSPVTQPPVPAAPRRRGASAPRRQSNEPPARDAPIDTWLDWREAEIKRGRSSRAVSFRKLEEMSAHSQSQFKHRSSARKRTEN